MEVLELDAIDLQLLSRLQQDATPTNQDLAAAVGISPPTCLRRVRRLREIGLIERQVAIVQPDLLAAALGHGLHAMAEVLLDRQTAEAQDTFGIQLTITAHLGVQRRHAAEQVARGDVFFSVEHEGVPIITSEAQIVDHGPRGL